MIRKRILIISLMVTVFAFMPVNVGAATKAFLDEFPPYGDKWTLETGDQSIATAKIKSGELQIWTLAEGKYAEIYVYANEVSCLDFNCDEFINIWDLSILSDNWLKRY